MVAIRDFRLAARDRWKQANFISRVQHLDCGREFGVDADGNAALQRSGPKCVEVLEQLSHCSAFFQLDR